MIIVVISLLTMLVFLGLFFWNWTSQERANSEYFAFRSQSSLGSQIPRERIEDIFNKGMQQVLVSTPDGSGTLPTENYPESALHGSRWSILAHVIGPLRGDGRPFQKHLYSGQGIRVQPTGDNTFRVVYGEDPAVFATQDNFVLNFSLLANNGNNLLANPAYDFNPAAGYTYPDINSLFLATDYIDPITNLRVIKPSFALPGYFPLRRDWFIDPDTGEFTSRFAGWYTNPNTVNQVLRPHRELRYPNDGTVRYVRTPTPAVSGDTNRILQPFPFTVNEGRMGVWDGSGEMYTFLDVDLSGDGINDSIAVDLGYNIFELDGRQFVPIYYFKILDQDALLNLNVHGHMPEFQYMSTRNQASIGDQVFDRNTWVHYSNLGVTPAEVNPQIALYADPSSNDFIAQPGGDPNAGQIRNEATVAHRGMMAGAVNHTQFNRTRMSNMEMAMLLIGHPEFDPDTLQLGTNASQDRRGRFGFDNNALRNALLAGVGRFPSPGTPGVDDDQNSNNFASTRSGGMMRAEARIGVNLPPFVHPLDFVGIGNSLEPNGSTIHRTVGPNAEIGERMLATGGLANNPLRWPSYPAVNFPDGTTRSTWQNQGRVNAPAENVLLETYRDAIVEAGNRLQQGDATDYLIDEANEVIVDRDFANDTDQIFSTSEIAGLHLSDSDWRKARMPSRVRSLAPFNFEYNRQAHRIRSQFTTESWDRVQFSHAPPKLANDRRLWEFNDDSNPGEFRFPPRFGSVNPSRHENTFVSANDPFRPEVRRLLTVRWGANDFDADLPQRKLNLNRILSDDVESSGNPDFDAFDIESNPLFRDLVPHAFFTMNQGSIPPVVHQNVATLASFAPTHPIRRFNEIGTDPLVQEWWARYDRQRLCRDIYVLLYTLAGSNGGNPDPDLGSSPVMVPIDPDQAREMAQFAVNYVDAMDRDDVITEFQYDPDLSNGWSSDPAQLESVFGVESQKLTFSEVMLIETAASDEDSPRTLHDDRGVGGHGHRFLYIELRNVSPFPIDLEDQTWRIARVSPVGTDEVVDMAAEFIDDGSNNFRVIPPGANFLIACHDGSVVNGAGQQVGSELYVNIDTDQDNDPLQLIYPRANTAVTIPNSSARPDPVVDLDLTPRDGSNHVNFRRFAGQDSASTYTGTTLVEQLAGSASGPGFTLVLQRRRNLRAFGTGEEDWIEVDRVQVNPADFSSAPFLASSIDMQPNQMQLQTDLQEMHSMERLHPYSREFQAYSSGSSERNHSLRTSDHPGRNVANQSWIDTYPGRPYWFWQPHFDRDFSSAVELLSVPLYGNRSGGDTNSPIDYDDATWTNAGVVANLVNSSGTENIDPNRTAQLRFLDQNERWYRLLNFVEIPPQNEKRFVDAIQKFRRTPGRINLNTLRHEHVLAGLVDDPVHHDPVNDEPTRDLLDANRRWIEQFIRSRDGLNSSGDQQPPGTHLARPFHPFNFVATSSPNASLEHTLLRRNVTSSIDSLGLFEARDIGDVGIDSIDPHTRHRLLSKVLNNSTTRSHIYAIWAGFALHDAHQLPNGNVQVGARAEDLPLFRRFYIVDMTRLEEAHDSGANRFLFEEFIIHQQQLP